MTGKALVTGATGHLGANLVRRLLADGEEVRALVRPGDTSAALNGLPVERVTGDLRDANAVTNAVRGCARVYHTGAIVSTVEGNVEHKRAIFETNVLGTQYVLDAALASGVNRVVVTGSFSAVGYDPDQPSRPSNEEMPFDPFHSPTPYSTSKAAAEQQCWQAAARGLPVVVAVSCAIVGPNDFVPSRLGGVMCSFGRIPFYIPGGFPFVAARDISQGHVLAMNKGRSGERYIFATAFHTMDEIMAMFEAVTGQKRPPLRLPPSAMSAIAQLADPFVTRWVPPERHRLTPAAVRILRLGRRADISKARRELGYEPTSIAEAVREAYAFYREHGMIRSTAGSGSAGTATTVSLHMGAP
ncbi:MAG TPA: NAD-dependent epimerase/dehydratase family protein [Polyangiaceae bacterium]|jgi:nucleoside-diphosphate-sugar epimerase|nr:NAD-dependent epimerase/dehydratase family protein [Polyangiaceae bacterium]